MPQTPSRTRKTKRNDNRDTTQLGMRVPRATNLNMVNLGLGFPKMLRSTLRYSEQFQITTGTGTSVSYIFSANGLYDPNITSTGHQPLYFDQIMAVYDHYTVESSRFKAIVTPVLATQAASYVTLTIGDDASVTNPSPASQAEQSLSSSRVILPAGCITSSRLNSKWNCRDFFGPDPLDNDELKGTASGMPNEQSTYIINLAAIDGASTVAVFVELVIEFDSVFRELHDIAAS